MIKRKYKDSISERIHYEGTGYYCYCIFIFGAIFLHLYLAINMSGACFI